MNFSRTLIIILSILILSFWSLSVADEIPRQLSYQGILTNGSENNVSDGTYTLEFRIYDIPTGGTPIWSESKQVLVSGGTFETALGSSTALNLNFDAPYYLGIVVENDTEISPRMPLSASPYSMKAGGVSDSSITSSKLVDGAVTQEKLTAGLTLPPSGAASGDLSGTFPSPMVSALNGIAVSTNAPNDGDVLKYDGTSWAPAADENGPPIWSTNSTTAFLLNRRVGFNMSAPVSMQAAVKGKFGVYNTNGENKIKGQTVSYGTLETFGPTSHNVSLSAVSGSGRGYLAVHDLVPNQGAVQAFIDPDDFGKVWIRGANDITTLALETLDNWPNHGLILVRASTLIGAGVYVNENGSGVVWGDVKNFRIQNPSNPDEEIWYASLEGPEAGAYIRGTATLREGNATITFPEHFQSVAAQDGMTIRLTPLDVSSEGLAVISKSLQGFEVRELRNGIGTYEFDWEVNVVRKGYENYQVVRPRQSFTSNEEAVAEPGSTR